MSDPYGKNARKEDATPVTYAEHLDDEGEAPRIRS